MSSRIHVKRQTKYNFLWEEDHSWLQNVRTASFQHIVRFVKINFQLEVVVYVQYCVVVVYRYKKVVESLKNEVTVLYLSFITFITNDFECFLITFQSMTPRNHLLYTEMIWLIRTLMSKFLKSRLMINEIDGKKSPQINY